MANIYKNAQFDLTTTDATDVYTKYTYGKHRFR